MPPIEQEAIIVIFRLYTLLPLDDCLYALQPSIPDLTRSSLHSCFQRHGICAAQGRERQPKRTKVQVLSRLATSTSIWPKRTEKGELYMFVAIDGPSSWSTPNLQKAANGDTRRLPDRLTKAVPYKIHTILTDNGIQFTTGRRRIRVPLIIEAMANGERFSGDAFEYALARKQHRLPATKLNHPWTNGQVERMNRTIKEATVKPYYYQSHDHLRRHLHTS